MEEYVLQFRSLKSNIRPLAMPLGVVLVIIILVILTAPVIYGRIRSSLSEINDLRKRSLTLEEKLSSLQNVQNNILPNTSNVVLALPDRNPALYKWNVISSTTDDEEGISISNFKTQAQVKQDDKELKSMIISTSYEGGSMDQIMRIIQNAKETIPVTAITSFAYKKERDEVEYAVDYVVYWSDLPETISKISDPLNTLNQEQMRILSNISSLRKPQFTQLDATSYPDRTSPFQ